jgi:hypothetical protein
MRNSPVTTIFGNWTHPSYEVRVRGTPTPPMYLWGSDGVKQNIPFDKPFLLHVRNDVFGETIEFGTSASGTLTILGTLKAGECISIPIKNITGVFATCLLESTVACLIKGYS